MNRDFKGVWIPKEIWLNEELTLLEKIIFIEIDSLDNEEHCIAGNEYFATFCNCSESKVSKAIKKLKELNMVEELSFDGRHRKLRVVKSIMQDSKKCYAESQNLQSNNIDNNTTNKEKVVSKDTTTEFEFGKQKSKKENLYTKCVTSIQTFTSDKDLRSELENFLQLRLQMARDEGKSFYYGMWTHLLDELKQLAIKDDKLDVKLAWEIVNTSTIRGWKHFYELTDNEFVRNYSVKDKPWEKGVKSEGYTEEEKRQIEKEREEMEARGERVWY